MKLYYFTDGIPKIAFNINLDSHHFTHNNSVSTIKTNYSAIKARSFKRKIKEKADLYARLKYQYIIKKYFERDLINKMKTVSYYIRMDHLIFWILIKVRLSLILMIIVIDFN